MDDAEQLMPAYLRFVRGVIDSNDLPLNVSREILQESRDVKAIREGSTKRVLSHARRPGSEEQDKDKYATFWKEFGQVLKEGIGEDCANRERIAKLLRFASTHERCRRADRVARRLRRPHEGRPGRRSTTSPPTRSPPPKNSPHLEIFRKKGIEVLLLYRPRRRVDAVVPDRVRRQAAAVGRQGRPRPGQAGGRSREEEQHEAGRASSRSWSSA